MTLVQRAAARLALSALMLTAAPPTISAADAATWKLDSGKSKLGFSGIQTGTKFQGVFTHYDAAIEFDPDRLETSRIAVSVDLASATTNHKQRDTALPGKDWFDVARFSTAKFETKEINRKGADACETVGTLTLRGVAALTRQLCAMPRPGSSRWAWFRQAEDSACRSHSAFQERRRPLDAVKRLDRSERS